MKKLIQILIFAISLQFSILNILSAVVYLLYVDFLFLLCGNT